MKYDTCLNAALRYLDLGWAALAVCPPRHQGVPEFHRQTCQQPGKRPLGRWKGWQTRMPTMEEVVAQWEVVPRANVGVVLGPVSGLVGVDVDGAEGEQILQELSRGDLPRTLSFATSRGTRLLYAIPPGVSVANRTLRRGGSEVKILSAGTLTVMPPSKYLSGKKYRWLRRRGPGHQGAASAPEWIVRPPSPSNSTQPCSCEPGETIPEGQRNERLFHLSCAMRRHGCTEVEILHAVRLVNRRCAPPLAEGELRELARNAGRYPAATK